MCTRCRSIGRATSTPAIVATGRIHVFDSDGNFMRFLYMNVPYDKTRHPVLGNLPPNRPDETAPWTMCITNGPTQYLFVMDSEPGRLYKMTLDGKIVGVYGESGRQTGQFNWPHGTRLSVGKRAVRGRHEQLARS